MCKNHWVWSFAITLVVLGTVVSSASAQNGMRIYQEELRVSLDQQDPADREIGFDAGGWFNYALFYYKDAGSNRNRALNQFQLRGWASLNYQNVHHFYVRGLLNWNVWGHNQNPSYWHGDTEFESEIERAWYMVDVGRLLGQKPGEYSPVGLRVKVGREFMTIGTAFTLSMPLDMVQFNLRVKDFDFRAFLGKTIYDTPNIDYSWPVADHQKRCFYGFELAYNGFSQQRPFIYYMSQSDHTKPDQYSPWQKYDYSSSYLGIGSEGTLFIPGLTYLAEIVGEWGSTYSENETERKDDICAMAADFQLQYVFNRKMHPRIKYEYMWGSGDNDRRLSSNSTDGGNLAGTKDHAFNAFGFRDTGIAFAPRVSNIHIHSLTGAFMPFEDSTCEFFRKMEIGSVVFFYSKDKANGGISDWTCEGANNGTGKWLGWEWDVFCNWRLTSDLAWTIRYGLFQPSSNFGSAYDSSRHFLYTGVSLSF